MSSDTTTTGGSKLVTASVALGSLQVQITVKRTATKETWPPWSVKVSDGSGGEVSLDARAVTNTLALESAPTSVVDDLVLNSLGFDSRGDELPQQTDATQAATSSSNRSDLLQPFYDHLSDSVDFLTTSQPHKMRKTNENHHDQLQYSRRQTQASERNSSSVPPDISSAPPQPPLAQMSTTSFLEAFTAPPNNSSEPSFPPASSDSHDKSPNKGGRKLLSDLSRGTGTAAAEDMPSASTEPPNISASSSQTIATSETVGSVAQSQAPIDKKTDNGIKSSPFALSRAATNAEKQSTLVSSELRRTLERAKRTFKEVEEAQAESLITDPPSVERSSTSTESSGRVTVQSEPGVVESAPRQEEVSASRAASGQSASSQLANSGSEVTSRPPLSPRPVHTTSPSERSNARDPVILTPEESKLLKNVQWPQVTKPGSDLPTLYCHLCYLREKVFKKIEATSPHGNRVYFRHRSCSASYGSGEAFPKPLVDLYVAHFLTKRQSLSRRKS